MDLLVSTWPIVRREFVGLLRTRKAFWIAVLTVSAASLFPLLAWPAPGNPLPYRASHRAYWNYFQALSFAVFLFVPAVAAGAISGERQRDTYDLLYHTLIHPPGIVLGKLIATGGYFLLLLALTSPMVCVLLLLGGFRVWEFVIAFGVTAAGILFLALLGLWCSMRSRRTYKALISAFALLIGLCVALVILAAFGGGGIVLMLLLLGSLCPFFFSSLLGNAAYPDLPSFRQQDLVAHHTAQLRGPTPRPERTWLTSLVLDPRGIPDGWNPVLVNSIQSDALGTARARQKLFWGFGALVSLVMLVGLLLMAASGDFRLDLPLVTNTHLLLYSVALIVAGSSAASLAGERELGKLDFLRSTLLSPRRILWGKLWACLFGVSGLFILGVLFCVIILFLSILGAPVSSGNFPSVFDGRVMMSVAFLGSAAVVAISCASFGLLAATLSRTTVAAAVLSYVFSAANLLALPLLATMPLAYSERQEVLGTMSPLLAFSWCVNDVLERDDESRLAAFAGSLGLSLLVSGVAFVLALAIFHRRWMRDA